MAYKTTGGQNYRLGSSIGSTDTTILLSSFTEPISGVPYTMTLIGSDIVYGTISPQSDNSEFISFTGITQNVDGTATLTGVVRGLARSQPYTAQSVFQLPHAGQSIFILSDAPQVFNQFTAKENNETVSGNWDFTGQVTFANFPITPSNPVATPTIAGIYKLTTNVYADDTGAVNAYAIAPDPTASLVKGQIFTFIAGSTNTGASTLNINSLGAKTIKKFGNTTDLQPGDIVASQMVQVEYDGTVFQLMSQESGVKKGSVLFGGSGADGALNVTAGTTTINLGGAAVVIKNYTSINIANGTTVNFSNPHPNGTIIVFKSQGAVTVAGTLDASGMGAAGGVGASTGAGNNPGNIGNGILENTAIYGGGSSAITPGAAGLSFTYPMKNFYTRSQIQVSRKNIIVYCGSGGGGGCASVSGGTPSGTGGNGGNGGGAIYIECFGALTFTGIINVNGSNGGNNSGQGSGGGGGAAGSLTILYNTLTSNSGTVHATGGSGGSVAGGAGSPGNTAGGGGGAGSWTGTGGAGTGAAGVGAGAGGGGAGYSNSATPGGGGGGDEGSVQYIGLNTDFF